jgi:hypothetical protein
LTKTGSNIVKNVRGHLAKTAILLVISLGAYAFSEQFSPTTIFEPQTKGWVLWTSYAKDLIQPFAFYYFLCLGERCLKTWQARALLSFGLPTLVEFGQGLYYRVANSHYVGAFDPMDIIVYGIGVGLAVLVEQKIFAKVLGFW